MREMAIASCDIPDSDKKNLLVSFEAVPKEVLLAFFREVQKTFPSTNGLDYYPPGNLDDELGFIDEELIPPNEFLSDIYGVYYTKDIFGASDQTLIAYSTDVERAVDFLIQKAILDGKNLPRFWIQRYDVFYYYKSAHLCGKTQSSDK